MNTYIYKCDAGHEVEIEHPMGDNWDGEECVTKLGEAFCALPIHRVYLPTQTTANKKGKHNE